MVRVTACAKKKTDYLGSTCSRVLSVLTGTPKKELQEPFKSENCFLIPVRPIINSFVSRYTNSPPGLSPTKSAVLTAPGPRDGPRAAKDNKVNTEAYLNPTQAGSSG